MKWIGLIIVCTTIVAGCASKGASSAHVLSGEAPVDKVVSRADHAALEGDFHAASILYSQALSQEPSADLWYRLGAVLMQRGETGEAMWAFRSALELDPRHADALERIGFYLTAKDRPDEARPYLDRLLEIEPDNWRAYNTLGVLADLQGNYVEAAGHYASAIERNPDDPMLWNNLGFSYYLSGDYHAAIRTLSKALELESGYAAAWQNIALVLARQARYDEALGMMKRSRGEAQAYTDIGYLAYKMGDYGKAEELLTEAINRSSTYNRQAHRNLANVREARADTGSGR